MLFFEPIYIFLFFPLVLIFFYFSENKYDLKILLIIFSLLFYSYWNIKYVPLLLLFVFSNFIFGKLLLKNSKKLILLFAISFNILILILFKYIDFIILNLNLIFKTNIKIFDLPFPLAISFITFQSIAFLINCYDKQILKIKFKEFFLFICFFPQLIAGPIVIYNNIISQYRSKNFGQFNLLNFNTGLIIFFIGFFKKIYFADTLGHVVDVNMLNLENLGLFDAWITSISYSFQFYFDFTAYVDMATGSALMLNIILPQNFNSPFKAKNIINFWQRWHMTLTSFLTNYLYTPWLMSLKNLNFFKSMVLLFIVFFIAGLWHGPSWNYVIFGSIHGIGLIINHIFRKLTKFELNKIFSIILTFNFVNLSFIFFRNKDFAESTQLIDKMFNLNNNFHISEIYTSEFKLLFILSFILIFYFANTYTLVKKIYEN